MNKLAGVLFVVGTLFVVSENFKVVAVFFYAASFLSFLSTLAGSSIEEEKKHTASMKKYATNRFNASERKRDRYVRKDSHLATTVAGAGIVASMVDDDDSSFINDNNTPAFDDDISLTNSISNTFDETEDMIVNPASGLLMIGGIGGVDAGGNVYGSDSMSDMHTSMDNSSMFSDDLISTTDSFDTFGSSSSIDDSFGTDDSFSSFDDSFSSMDDDW
tara:strand:+ start:3508 stop:4158 length:651 start_codon:yes stop_codon:yes gene_type:complete